MDSPHRWLTFLARTLDGGGRSDSELSRLLDEVDYFVFSNKILDYWIKTTVAYSGKKGPTEFLPTPAPHHHSRPVWRAARGRAGGGASGRARTDMLFLLLRAHKKKQR